MHPFLIAIQFLTRLPVKSKGEWQEKQFAESVLYYPLIGVIIGGILCSVAYVSAQVEPMLLAGGLLVLWIVFTGGLHLDGLADSADAWAGGYGDKQRSLDIMKDPAAGPIAVVVLVLLLLVKFISLAVLLKNQQIMLLVIPPVLGRLSIIILFLTTPYVRTNGLGSAIAEYLHRKSAYTVIACILIAGFVLFSVVQFIVVLLSCAVVLYFLRRIMMRRLQGMTGDTLGGSLEIVEAVSLFALAIIL